MFVFHLLHLNVSKVDLVFHMFAMGPTFHSDQLQLLGRHRAGVDGGGDAAVYQRGQRPGGMGPAWMRKP